MVARLLAAHLGQCRSSHRLRTHYPLYKVRGAWSARLRQRCGAAKHLRTQQCIQNFHLRAAGSGSKEATDTIHDVCVSCCEQSRRATRVIIAIRVWRVRSFCGHVLCGAGEVSPSVSLSMT